MEQDVVPCFEQLNSIASNYCVHPHPYCSTFPAFMVVAHCRSLLSFDSVGSCQRLVFVLLLDHRHLRQPGPSLRHWSTLSGLLQPTWRILAPSAYRVLQCSPIEGSWGCLHRLVNSRCCVDAAYLRIALVAAALARSFLLSFVYLGWETLEGSPSLVAVGRLDQPAGYLQREERMLCCRCRCLAGQWSLDWIDHHLRLSPGARACKGSQIMLAQLRCGLLV